MTKQVNGAAMTWTDTKILRLFYVSSESQKENFDVVWVMATSFELISYSSLSTKLTLTLQNL
jgi:hypothetical protein